MLRTISLCSGKGGVGKTLLAAGLARIIQREENCKVLLADLDLSVSGLTLLAFRNKIELDQVPFSLFDYLTGDDNTQTALFEALQAALMPKSESQEHSAAALYQRLDRLFVLPASVESERPDWKQSTRIELDLALEKVAHLRRFADKSLDADYLIFDTQAGLGSLSLAAATLSDMNIILMEEDDISWSTSLRMFTEVTELNKRLQHRSRSYFLANKVHAGMMDMAVKLKAFSFLPPLPFDSWAQRLMADSSSAVLRKLPRFSDSIPVRSKTARLPGGDCTKAETEQLPRLGQRPRRAVSRRSFSSTVQPRTDPTRPGPRPRSSRPRPPRRHTSHRHPPAKQDEGGRTRLEQFTIMYSRAGRLTPPANPTSRPCRITLRSSDLLLPIGKRAGSYLVNARQALQRPSILGESDDLPIYS